MSWDTAWCYATVARCKTSEIYFRQYTWQLRWRGLHVTVLPKLTWTYRAESVHHCSSQNDSTNHKISPQITSHLAAAWIMYYLKLTILVSALFNWPIFHGHYKWHWVPQTETRWSRIFYRADALLNIQPILLRHRKYSIPHTLLQLLLIRVFV